MVRIPIMGANFKPGSAGVYQEPYSVEAGSGLLDHLVLVFESPAGQVLESHGVFEVPQDYVGGGKCILVYTSAVAADVSNTQFRMELAHGAVGGTDSEVMDPASAVASSFVNPVLPSVAFERMEAELPLSQVAAGDTVPFMLSRDGTVHDPTDNDDDVNGKILVLAILFEYVNS